MAESTVHGGCHCGAVRYTTTIDLASESIHCNCSMCGRAGTLLSFVPAAKFTIDQGADSLSVYKFNKHVIDHLFCKVCGIKPFSRGKGPHGDMVAVNMRTIDDIDQFAIPAKQFDGKSR